MRQVCYSAVVIGMALCVGNCQRFQKLDREVKRLEEYFYLKGRMDRQTETQGTLWAFVLEKDTSGMVRFVDIDQVAAEGVFSFMLPPGEDYYVGVAEDLDGNERREAGERLWLYGDPSPVPFVNGQSELLTADLDHPVDVNESDRRALDELRAGRSLFALKSGGYIPVAVGDIADLQEPRFSVEMGEAGLWTPETFLHEAGMGVYFLEAYDPHRIPVLFVHGAGGSPRHFQKLFDTLDRRRYQCWFYHYPTGMRLQKTAQSLNHIVEDLHDRHRFAAMHVVAYSMGGLVSRSFILQNQESPEADYLRHYITISTPWNGHKMAALGVEHAPSVIPSWIDMQTNSDFIKDMLARRLNRGVDYHLMFSFKGTNSMFLPSSNDGTVSLASQLDPRAQDQAVSRMGFNLDHIEIIADERLVECVAGILGGE